MTERARMTFEDYQDIQRLLFRYASAVDQADWGVLAELFAEAEVRASTSDDVSRGGEAIAELWRGVNRVHADGTLRTRHLITNVMIDGDGGDGARAASYFMVFQQTDDLPLQPIAGGRYEDTFARRDGAWRFTSKFIDVTQVGDTSEHLVVSLRDGPIRF